MRLDKEYNRSDFLEFLNNFLPNFSKDVVPVGVKNLKEIKEVNLLGRDDELELAVFEVMHNSINDPRIALATDGFRIMKDYSEKRALIVYKSNKDNDWRLSLMTMMPVLNEKGKMTREFSNPRRFSFFLGENAKIHTPTKFLIAKGIVKDFEDLQNRFSLDVVNKQFYLSIAKYFDELVSEGNNIFNMPSGAEVNIRKNFAVRLIGRIMFCWFLKQKKSDRGQLIPDELLSSGAVNNGYYHEVLERLFFEILNTEIDNRHIKSDLYDKVPYLNGGLFSPQYDDYYDLDIQLGVSKHINTLKISDKWFKDFFGILENYNFTIDENTVIDQEISVDPEMLGRIFENLLAEIDETSGISERKRTGSFYTPRQIVEYMVDQSLSKYLKTKTGINDSKLNALITYDKKDDFGYPLNDNENKLIVDAVSELKILDPACGSGAYPISVLQKAVHVLEVVDADGKLWRDKTLAQTPLIYRQRIEEELSSRTLGYIRKLEVIKNSIFGIDIQPIAVEVARLRCFLTLVVEEEIDDTRKNRGIEPLPNLDFKFTCANTLINLPNIQESQTQGLFEDQSGIETLSQIMSEYFSSHKKKELQMRFKDAQNKILLNMIKNRNIGELTQKLTIWDPFTNKENGWFDPKWMFGIEDLFDIVIGNPPYVQLQKNKGELANYYKDERYDVFVRAGDIYALFYERGLKLSEIGSGLLCYITSNKWMRAGYGEKLRGFFARKDPLNLIDFGGFKVFESATVDTNILLIENSKNKNHLKACHFRNDYKKNQSINEYFEENKVVLSNLSSDTWFIGSEAELSLKKKIEKMGTPLKEWNLKINFGVKTGFNEAFIIDQKKRDELIAKDSKSAEIIKPILRGRDVKRYSLKFASLYLITTFPALNIDIDKYQSIKEYLMSYRKRLEQSGKAGSRKKTYNKWFETQDQISYYDEFEKDTITWQEIATKPAFSFVQAGMVTLGGNYFMSNVSRLLLAVLNSNISHWYFNTYFQTIGEKGLRYKPQYLYSFPAPKTTSKNQCLVSEIEPIVDVIIKTKKENIDADTAEQEKQIDQLVYKLYDLTEEEIKLIENER